MKKYGIRKPFAIFGALLTGGLTIGLIGMAPHTAEAAMGMN